MGNAGLKRDFAHVDLIRDLAHAQEARKIQFAAMVRFVRRREASGPAKDGPTPPRPPPLPIAR